MITVVNFGISNIGSVCKALDFLKIAYEVTDDKNKIENAKKIILPGVGSFLAGVEALKENHLFEVLQKQALQNKIPFFGFCLGMQLMFEKGVEGGAAEGLGLVKGSVVPLEINREKYAVPHMGWNDVHSPNMKIFEGLPQNSCFYFVHSFEAQLNDPETVAAYTEYGEHKIVAAIEKKNIWGAQFHPERSQKVGLHILKNFAELPC